MTHDEQLVREYLRPLRTAEPVRRRSGQASSGGWGGRLKLGVAIAVGAAVVAGVLLVLALAAQSRNSNRPAHRPAPTTDPAPTFREGPAPEQPAEEPTARFGEPVKLADMTFVVNSLTAVHSIPIPNQQPLLAEPGKRLWLLTVRVRNDGPTTAREPICHRRHRPGRTDYLIRHGPELVVTKDSYWVGWMRESLLIDNHLCRSIQPGETTTFQLIYSGSSGFGRDVTVVLSNRTETGEWVHAAVVR